MERGRGTCVSVGVGGRERQTRRHVLYHVCI